MDLHKTCIDFRFLQRNNHQNNSNIFLQHSNKSYTTNHKPDITLYLKVNNIHHNSQCMIMRFLNMINNFNYMESNSKLYYLNIVPLYTNNQLQNSHNQSMKDHSLNIVNYLYLNNCHRNNLYRLWNCSNIICIKGRRPCRFNLSYLSNSHLCNWYRLQLYFNIFCSYHYNSSISRKRLLNILS